MLNASSTSKELRAPVLPRKPQQQQHSFVATCCPGLESVLLKELQSPAIGAQNAAIRAGAAAGSVHFNGDVKVGYNACLWLRCGTRLLHRIAAGDLDWARSTAVDPLYDFVKTAVDWPAVLRSPAEPGVLRSFSVETSVRRCSRRSSALYASTSAEAAIRDSARESGLTLVDQHRFVIVPLFLSVSEDRAELYRDMSGAGALEKRGYRRSADKESLSGGVAAGILAIAGWNRTLEGFGEQNKSPFKEAPVLLDPMCGCGTFLIEAALMACNAAPGLLHPAFPFQNWHDFDEKLWAKCRLSALQAAVKPPSDLQLLGNDIDEAALQLCREEAQRANVEHLLQLSCSGVREYTPPLRPSLVTVNPPWCERIYMEKQSLFTTNLSLGRFLKRCCGETDAYILSSGRWVANAWRMKADARWPLTIDNMDFKLLHYYVLPQVKQSTTNL